MRVRKWSIRVDLGEDDDRVVRNDGFDEKWRIVRR